MEGSRQHNVRFWNDELGNRDVGEHTGNTETDSVTGATKYFVSHYYVSVTVSLCNARHGLFSATGSLNCVMYRTAHVFV